MSARIQQIYIAMFGRPADPLGLTFWNNATNNGANLAPIVNALAGTAEYQARFAGQSNVQLVNSIYQSLFGRDADVAGLTFFVNQLSSGAMNLGTIAINILDGAQGTDKGRIDNKVTAATAFTAAIDTTPEILAYNSAAVPAAQAFLAGITDVATTIPTAAATTAAVLAITTGSTGAPGTTFTLATTPDNIVGTSGADTFNGYISTATAAGTGSTLNVSDNINGGAGIDTLKVTVDGDGTGNNGLPAATISGVEVLSIRNVATGGAQSYDLGLIAGETQVINNVSTRAVTFTNLEAGAGVTVLGNASTTNANTSFSTVAATQAVAVTLDGGVTGGNVVRTNTGAAAITVNSNGAANFVGTLDLDGGTSLTAVTVNASTALFGTLDNADYAANAKLTITGAGSVDLSGSTITSRVVTTLGGTSVANNITTIDASANTGGVTVYSGAAAAVIKGGTGNDTLGTTATLTAAGAGSLDGGAGTDTLVLFDQAQLTATNGVKFTNFEILSIADDADDNADTFNVSQIAGLTGIDLAAISTNDAVTLNNVSAALAGAVNISGSLAAGPTINVTGATTVGQLDTLSLTVNDGLVGKNTLTVASITAAGVETVNINATDNLTLSAADGLGALTALKVEGAGNVSITTGALAVNVNTTVNASALTGTFVFDATAATANSLAITGSATKANTITGTDLAGSADVITGGAGIDNVTGLAGNDVISTLAGNDIIAGGAGSDKMSGGEGNDRFDFASTAQTRNGSFAAGNTSYANIDHITDFNGNGAAAGDSIQLAGTANVFGGTLDFSATTVATVTAVTVATAADFTALAAAVQAASAGVASADATAQIYDVTVTGGNLAGRVLIINDNTAAIAATDTFINITGVTGALNAQDFLFIA